MRLEESLLVIQLLQVHRGPFEEGESFGDVSLRRRGVIEIVLDEKDDLLNERRARLRKRRANAIVRSKLKLFNRAEFANDLFGKKILMNQRRFVFEIFQIHPHGLEFLVDFLAGGHLTLSTEVPDGRRGDAHRAHDDVHDAEGTAQPKHRLQFDALLGGEVVQVDAALLRGFLRLSAVLKMTEETGEDIVLPRRRAEPTRDEQQSHVDLKATLVFILLPNDRPESDGWSSSTCATYTAIRALRSSHSRAGSTPWRCASAATPSRT